MSYYENNGELTVKNVSADKAEEIVRKVFGERNFGDVYAYEGDEVTIIFENLQGDIDAEMNTLNTEIIAAGGELSGEVEYLGDYDGRYSFYNKTVEMESPGYLDGFTTEAICQELLKRIEIKTADKETVDGLLGHPVSYERLLKSYQDYVDYDLEATEANYVYDLLSRGMKDSELRKLGFGYILDMVPKDEEVA